MNLPQENGTFLGSPAEWAVNNSTNGYPQFVCRFNLTARKDGDQWVDCQPEDLEITWYANLAYKSDAGNTLNQISVDNIKKVFGWDGRSLESLNTANWSNVEAQVVCEQDTYKGKTKMGVKYVNPKDYEGGGIRSDPQQVKSLDQLYGPLLRASAGNGKPATTLAPAKETPEQSARKNAWKEFTLKTSGMDKDTRTKAWKDALDQYFGEGVEQAALSLAEWKNFTDAVKGVYESSKGFPLGTRKQQMVASPISNEPEFKDDDIPF